MGTSIGFVILHYNVVKETKDCVVSIVRNLQGKDYGIVIVDNASPNKSGKYLEKYYSRSEKIHVLLNQENLGFAKGNNIGYRYATDVLKSDFICILNNDTIIEQNNFLDIIEKEYGESHFGVMGPKIILKNGQTNPLYVRFPEKYFFEEELQIHRRDYWQMKWRLNYPIVAIKLLRNKIYQLIGKEIHNRHAEYQQFSNLDEKYENVVLHGCCLIFSPQYIECYQEAFHPDTFLYKEEELLYLRCKNKNLKMVYNPQLIIKHLEDAATNSIRKRRRKRIMFWLENQIHSLEVLVGVMGEGEEQ